MSNKNESKEALEQRIKLLEEQIDLLKNVLGHFASGLDKVSQVQANQTEVIEGLIEANEGQTKALKRLIDNTGQQSKLLKKLVEK